MTTNGKTFPVLARVFFRSCAKRSSSAATSPPRTTCFDIFSPPPGDSDVISHVDRLSSNETKIAPRSVRTAVGASGRSATVCMVASRVGGSNLTLPKCRSLSTSPWDLEVAFSVSRAIQRQTQEVDRFWTVSAAFVRVSLCKPTGEQHDLAFTIFRSGSAPQQQFGFFFPSDEGGQAGRVQRLEAAFNRNRPQRRPGPCRPGDAL